MYDTIDSIESYQMIVTPAMVDAAMVEMANITPALKRSDCERLILAAIRSTHARDRDTSTRQNSLTATAMMQAPHGATYVWCNNELWYAIELRNYLKRADLIIRMPRWLDTGAPYSVRGQIIVDHALRLTPEQRELIIKINERNNT